MATQLQRKRTDEATTIPDRLYFKIGDVARICAVEPYVLRFWESQFPQLKPNKSGTGQRLYRKRDVELALEIKELVHAKGYTLSGARQALGQKQRTSTHSGLSRHAGSDAGKGSLTAAVQRARIELQAIATMLAEPVARPQKRRTRFAAVASGELFPS
jgi:DNA-binding transcriptional MerR regulator